MTSARARRGDLLYTNLVTPGQCAQCLAQLMQCLEPCLGAFIFVTCHMEAQNACRETLPISLASRSGTSQTNIPCSLHHRHVCRTICATADWVMQTQTLHVCKTFFTPRPLLLFSPTSYLSRIQEEAHNCSLAMLRDCCPVAILGPGQYIVWESHFLPEN